MVELRLTEGGKWALILVDQRCLGAAFYNNERGACCGTQNSAYLYPIKEATPNGAAFDTVNKGDYAWLIDARLPFRASLNWKNQIVAVTPNHCKPDTDWGWLHSTFRRSIPNTTWLMDWSVNAGTQSCPGTLKPDYPGKIDVCCIDVYSVKPLRWKSGCQRWTYRTTLPPIEAISVMAWRNRGNNCSAAFAVWVPNPSVHPSWRYNARTAFER